MKFSVERIFLSLLLMGVVFGWSWRVQASPGHVGSWEAESVLDVEDDHGESLGHDWFMDVGIDSEGSVIVVSLSGRVLKYGSSGTLLWEKRFNSRDDFICHDQGSYNYGYFVGPSGWSYSFSALDIASDGSIVVAGYRGSNAPEDHRDKEFVLKLGSGGNLLWYRDVGPVDWEDWGAAWLFPVSDGWLEPGPDVHVVPGAGKVLVSSGSIFSGDNGQYDLTEVSLSDGTILKQWNKGSVMDRFAVTPDGSYVVTASSAWVSFRVLEGEIGSYTVETLSPLGDDGKYLWIGDDPLAAFSPDGSILALSGIAFWSDEGRRFFFSTGHLGSEGRYDLDVSVAWARGLYEPSCDGEDPAYRDSYPSDSTSDVAVGPNGNIFVSGWLVQYDPASEVNERGCSKFYHDVGYVASLTPEGHITREVVSNDHVGVRFLALAVDAGGKVVAVGWRSAGLEGWWSPWGWRPYVVSDVLGQLPPYRYIKPMVQHRVHDPVDPATGNYAEVNSDFTYPTGGAPLSVLRSYSSRFASTDGLFGYGWSFNFGMRVQSTDRGVTVFWGDGHGDDFIVSGRIDNTTSYTPVGGDPGYRLTETSTTSQHFFTVRVPGIDRTIRFAHEEGGVFYPSLVFQGEDEAAVSAFPLRLTYEEGSPKSIVITDEAGGKAVTVILDGSGHIVRVEGPDGARFSYGYDDAGNLVQVQRADGTEIHYVYDDAHHLTGIVQGGKTLLSNTYDARGRVLSQTDALGRVTTFVYDDTGRKTTVTGPDGTKTLYHYDSQFRLVKIEDAHGSARTYSYDAVTGKLASITEPDGSTTRFSYDGEGNLVKKTDPLGLETTYGYDEQGNLVTAVTPGGRTARFTYDSDGRLTGYTLPGGGIYALDYDEGGHLAIMTNPAGASWSYERLASGLLSGEQLPDGTAVSYERDAAGRVVKKTYGGAHPVSFTFDALGRVTGVSDETGTVTYSYDALGFREGETGVDGASITYDFDDAGRLTGMKVLSLELTTERDEAGRPVMVGDNFGHRLTYTYDEKGRLSRVLGPAGTGVSYGYDPVGRVVSITYTGGGGTAFRTMSLTRDSAGRVTAVDDEGAPSPEDLPRALMLFYDAADRIRMGTHDAMGRLTSFNGKTYGYDVMGRLSSVTDGEEAASIGYDPLGRPAVIRDGNGTRRIVYSGFVPVAEEDDEGAVTRYLVLGPGMSLVLDGEGNLETILVSDWRENFVAALDGRGNPVAQRLYAPYGTVSGESGSWPVSFGFLGQAGLYTLSTGEVLTRNRAYDPVTGRFLSPDPSEPNPFQPSSLNRYIYAFDDPINLVDTAGLSPFAPTGPVWLIPCVGGVVGCNVRMTLHPTSTLPGVAGPPMNGSGAPFDPPSSQGTQVADATPIYSDRYADAGGGNRALTPHFTNSEGLVASPIYSDRHSEPPPPTPMSQNVVVAPGTEYVGGFSTVPIIALI